VALLVRSWNLFHGNTVPPRREAYPEQMVRLASADEPDVLCLQEVPVWAATQLEGWSGMRAFTDVAAPPRIGPLPSTPALGRALTALHPGILRSLFAGQANAILVSRRLRPLARHALVLNRRDFRRRQARWLRLTLVANVHATAYRPDERLSDAELLRAASFADALAHPDEPCILSGDFNVRASRSWTLSDLTTPAWGFSSPGPGIDHVLVRGAPSGPVVRWPDERRRRGDALLSDHAPVEVRVG
jgi:endonuclease/exonuclease/phosphatase family metal-dependent hydrolase